MFLLVTAKYSPVKKNSTDRLSNKPFLIWLLTTPPHLKCVATLPGNSQLIACFLTLIFSHGSVATYARRGGIANHHHQLIRTNAAEQK